MAEVSEPPPLFGPDDNENPEINDDDDLFQSQVIQVYTAHSFVKFSNYYMAYIYYESSLSVLSKRLSSALDRSFMSL